MRTALALLLVAGTLPARADSWPGPQIREVFSQSREYFVRVTPGGEAKVAKAEFYRRGEDRGYRLVAESALVNPVAPVDFFVADDGRLATLDNWHNLGYGKVAAFYAPDGKLVRAYELRELFPAAERAAFAHSVSSIHWRKGPAYVRQDQKTLLVTVREGADFVFTLDSGRFQYCETKEGRYRCR